MAMAVSDSTKTASCEVTVTASGDMAILRGIVYDDYSALPLSGVTVSFGAVSTTSAVDGSFSMDLPVASGTLTGDFSASKTGYYGQFVASASIDAANPPSLDLIPLHPIDTAGYDLHIISGRIYTSSGSELSSGTTVKLIVMRNGLNGSPHTFTYDTDLGYIVQTPVFGSDCLVVVKEGNSPLAGSYAMKKEINLSASETTLDLTLEISDEINFTGGTSGGYLFPALKTGYGPINGLYTSMSGSTGTLQLTNPLEYPVAWSFALQSEISDFTITKLSYGQAQVQAASVVAPSSATCPNFTVPTASSSATYDSVTSTLNFAASTEADCYRIRVSGVSFPYDVEFSSFSNSFVLPAWLASILASKTGTITITSLKFATFGSTNSLKLLSGWRFEFPENLIYSQANDEGFSLSF